MKYSYINNRLEEIIKKNNIKLPPTNKDKYNNFLERMHGKRDAFNIGKEMLSNSLNLSGKEPEEIDEEEITIKYKILDACWKLEDIGEDDYAITDYKKSIIDESLNYLENINPKRREGIEAVIRVDDKRMKDKAEELGITAGGLSSRENLGYSDLKNSFYNEILKNIWLGKPDEEIKKVYERIKEEEEEKWNNPKKIVEIPVEDWGLKTGEKGVSKRTARALRNHTDIETIGEITNMTDVDLMQKPGIGKKTFKEVKETLPYLGLSIIKDLSF